MFNVLIAAVMFAPAACVVSIIFIDTYNVLTGKK